MRLPLRSLMFCHGRQFVKSQKPYIYTQLCLFSKRHYSTNQSKIVLRDYQQKCIDACLEALSNNRRRIGISLPTGGGKTVVFANLIDHVKPREGYGNKTMILAHRQELITQAANTVKRILPNKSIEIEMANYHAAGDSDVIIASVQTLIRGRLEKFDPKDFKLIIIDEAHHAAAASYQKIIQYFGGDNANSDVAIAGFSATLQRDDEKNLSDAFDEVVFHMNTEEMVRQNHLSEAKFTTVRLTNADLGEVGMSRGEFVISKLSSAVNNEVNNEIVLRTYLHFLNNFNVKSTLLFGVDIQHVTDMAEVFQRKGVKADYVTSKTKKEVRSETVKNFKNGKLQVLMNCGIFTEGTDIPNIDCVLLVRPTASKNLLIQMIGRGLRLHESKDYCHIVDFVGINNNNIVSVPTLQGLPCDEDIRGLTLEEIEEKKKLLEEQQKLKEIEKAKLEELEKDKEAELLRRGVTPGAPIIEVDESEFMNRNLDLRTFESYEEFLAHGDIGKEGDLFYILTSKYPWLRIENNTWVLPYPASKGEEIHLRLQKHTKGLTKEFFKNTKVTEIYKSIKDAQNTKEVKGDVYSLSSYTLNKSPIGKRYISKLLLPISKDVRIPLSYVAKLLHRVAGKRDLSRFAPWRSEQATDRQLFFIIRFMQGFSRKLTLEHLYQLSKLKKGEASDFMSSLMISNTEYVRSLLYGKLDKRVQEQKQLYPHKRVKSWTEIPFLSGSRASKDKSTTTKQEDAEYADMVQRIHLKEAQKARTKKFFASKNKKRVN